jgi:CHAT domain
MTSPDPQPAQNTFNISDSSIDNLAGSGNIYVNQAANNPETQTRQDLASGIAPAPKVILFLAANPKQMSQLRLSEEVREIQEGLRRSQQRDAFVLEQRWAVRPKDVHRALLDLKPYIVHFSGHGIGEVIRPGLPQIADEETARKFISAQPDELAEGLYLEDETGQAKLVDTAALAGLFELFADRIDCVILNACYSAAQAEAIAPYVPAVIGMNRAIGDRAAIEFAVGFYDALGAGEAIEFAYRSGCSRIRVEGIPEDLTPVFKKTSGTL